MRSLSTCIALCYCVFLKNFCYCLVFLLVNMQYLYEYWDPNDRCRFIDISIYNITEDHSVAASQTKNDYIWLYFVLMKVKNNFLYEMVNRG